MRLTVHSVWRQKMRCVTRPLLCHGALLLVVGFACSTVVAANETAVSNEAVTAASNETINYLSEITGHETPAPNVLTTGATGDDGALYLTPMIRGGRVDEARAACAVQLPNATAGLSCSGYLTVNETYGSNLFFWFFPAVDDSADAPVVLWLQGGPGASSLFSVFNEHGPFSVMEGGRDVAPRDHAWTVTHSMLYVDSPVGTGYSFTRNIDGYSLSQEDVAHNLYSALMQFFELFPEYRNNDFYAAGESYAGKYVPAVSYTIHQKNQDARFKINLKGLAIGNGLFDPINQMVYSEYLYQHGLIDDKGKRKYKELEAQLRRQMAAKDFFGARYTLGQQVQDFSSLVFPSLYSDCTGSSNVYNMMWNENPIPYEHCDWENYVNEPAVRVALHVGRRPWGDRRMVAEALNDLERSVSPWLTDLLDTGRYRVLFYSGQLDIIVPFPGTVNAARSLRWSGAENFRNASRTAWRVPGTKTCGNLTNVADVAGYATTYGPLTVLMVRNAGHLVPYDQPVWAHDLIVRFTSDTPFQ